MALFNPLLVGVEGIGTPEELDRLRAELAARQPQYGKASNIGEGIGQLLTGIGSGIQNYRLGKAKKAGEASAATDRSAAYTEINKLLTGGVNSSFATPSQPSPQSRSATPVQGNMNNARAADRNSVSGYAGLDMKSGIEKSASALGISPVDLATAISYETAGTMDPTKRGPTTQWGQHRGLIQFGEPQAQKYGVDWNNPLSSQLGENGAVVKYLKDAGVQPGMGMLDVYSAINAGRVGRYGASDANNGGAPGTVADKVNKQMGGHRARALAMFGSPQGNVQLPGETSSADPQQAFSAVLGQQQAAPQASPAQGYVDPMVKVVPPTPAPQPTQPQQVAQAAPQDRGMMEAIGGGQGQGANYFPPAPGQQKAGGIDLPTLMKAAQNPWLDSGTRQFVNGLIQQEMQKQSPEYQMQQQKQQLEMQKLQKEISAPAERKTVVVNGRLVDATTGKLVAEYPDQTKPTDDMREYDFAKSQGFQGSFVDFQLAQKKAGATSITTNVGEGDKFYENLDKKNAETFAAMSDAGIQARAKMAQIDRLQGLMENAPQGWQGALKQAAGEWGIATEGLSDIQAATALIEKMVPEQRQPGSGQMSDADIKMFRASLPRIINQPGGNQLVFDTIRGIAQYETQMGEIADKVADRVISPAEGRRMIREMKNPLENFKVPKGEATPNEGRKTTTGATWSIDQ